MRDLVHYFWISIAYNQKHNYKMTEPNVASVPVTTFAKRQRRISPNNNLNSKAIKEASVVTELNFEDITTHDESEMMKTPNGAPRQATS